MPRPPRLHVPGGHYHVTLRGNHRESLFGSDPDRQVLDDIVADALVDQGARLHAYCWMTNHLHALVQIGDRPLGGLMHRIAVRFSKFRHRALATTGHLFERRYHARLVDADRYFLGVVRYVHLNPVKAALVSDPADYSWSSHNDYLGHRSRPWVTTEFALAMLCADRIRAIAAYTELVGSPTCDLDAIDSSPDGSGDPPNRGNAAMLRLQAVANLALDPKVTLDALAGDICARHGITASIVRSRAALRSLTPIRVEIARAAVEERVATLTEVANYLGRDPSTICQLLKRHPPNPQ